MWCVRKAAAGFYRDQVQWRLESGGWLGRAKADGTLTFAASANCHQNCCRSQAAAAVQRLKPLHQEQNPSLLSVSSAVAAGANLETIANLDPCQIHFLGSCSSKVAAVSAKPRCSEALTTTTAPSSLFWDSSSVVVLAAAGQRQVICPAQHTQYTWPIFYECCL